MSAIRGAVCLPFSHQPVLLMTQTRTPDNHSLTSLTSSPSHPWSRSSQKMAEAGRAVRVSGLPVGAEDERLKDKLLIHFLRARNGGGEIESVTVVKAMPVSALITFEERRGTLGWDACLSEGRISLNICLIIYY